jgi:cytochrome P450
MTATAPQPPGLPPAPGVRAIPPGPRSWNPLAVFKDLRRDPLAYLTRLTQIYGDVCSFKSLGQRYVILNHPDLAREVLLTQADAFWKGPALQNSKDILGEGLLTAEGETHKQQRRLMQPAFHAKFVENYAPVVIESTHDLLKRWTGAAWSHDVRPQMMGLTLVIAGRTLFGTLLADDIQTVHRCMDDLMNNYVRTVVPWGKLLNRLPLPSTLRLARAQRDLRQVVERMIAERRRALAGEAPEVRAARRDLLSTLIAATDPEARGVKLTDEQLRDQSITILTAGHETTANAMTFTLYLLAKHPEEQRKLRAEIRAVLGESDPSPELLDRLPRTRWVLSESMRLLPPAWTLGRQNRRAMELGGYWLPEKCTILIPQWTLHRDPRFWDRPLEFLPDRWREPRHPRFAYLPFSTGPRNCIGESFAWIEMMLALPMLINAFEFSLDPEAPELRLTPAITLRPRTPVELKIRPAPRSAPLPFSAH